MMRVLILVLVLLSGCNQLESTYRVVNRESRQSNRQIVYKLEYTGSLSFNNSEIRTNLDVMISETSDSQLNIKIVDSDRQNFEVPHQTPFLVDKDELKDNLKNENNKYIWDVKYDPFCIQVYESSTRQIVIDTCNREFIFSDKYLEIGSSRESESKLFGIGERFADFQLNDSQKYVLWSTDNAQGDDQGGDYPTYGNQAILLQMTQKVKSIVLFRTSSATEVQTDPSYINYKFVGGIIDMKVFVNTDTPSLMKDYRQYIGSHAVPPFWSLGHHQCRYGYRDLQHIERVMQGYEDLQIPIDTYWVDIDYLDTFYMFSNDQDKFNREGFRQLLNKFNKKTVPIIDPVIGANSYIRKNKQKQIYQTVLDGIERNVFLKDQTGFPLLAKQWAGAVFVPDFTHPNATQYWIDMFIKFDWPFDGLWIDMNEVSSFVFGKYNVSDEIRYIQQHPEKVSRDPNQNLFIYPTTGFPEQCDDEKSRFPYLPLNDCLSKKTLDINAVHSDGNLELYYHNLFSLLEQHATFMALQKKGHQLPFMITRSNTLNSHKYTFLWTGDNHAGYHSLANSIQGIIRSTFYGIQISGADMCGFLSQTNDRLCARWYQLGSLYPFSRNHNTLGMPDQDPASMGKLTQRSAYHNLRLRYSLLRQFYKTMLQNDRHDNFMQPLFMVFDDVLMLDQYIIKTQFMLGHELMSAPILEDNTFQRYVHFPTDFYDFHSGELMYSSNITNYYNDLVPLFLRSGHIVISQNTKNIRSTSDLSDKLVLKVGLDRQQQSKGSFILLNDLSNESDVIEYCIKSNCIADLHVEIGIQNGRDQLNINIMINDRLTYNRLKQNHKLAIIDRVHFYGLDISNVDQYYTCINIVIQTDIESSEQNCYGLKLEDSIVDRRCQYYIQQMIQYDIEQQQQTIIIQYIMNPKEKLNSCIEINRRLHPMKLKQNLNALCYIADEIQTELLQKIDLTLQVGQDSELKVEFICCEFNRDQDSYRSPHSNHYHPSLEDSQLYPKIKANYLFEEYRKLYYENGISSTYLWNKDNQGNFGLAFCVINQSDSLVWNSVSLVDVKKDSQKNRLILKLNTSISIGISTDSEMKSHMSGSLTRTKEDVIEMTDNEEFILAKIGSMIEDMETQMRKNLEYIYINKTQDIIFRTRIIGGNNHNINQLRQSIIQKAIEVNKKNKK